MLALALVALTDEFWSGVAVVAAPEVEREQRIEHGAYALLVFALPMLGSAVLEAGLALVADRYPRRRVAGLGLLAMSLALVLCALAPDGPALAIGLALAGAASGVACAAAQGELVTTTPDGGARAMTRWVLFGSLGDVLTPLVVAVLLSAGGSYRAAFIAAAALAFLQGGLLVAGGWRGRGAEEALAPCEEPLVAREEPLAQAVEGAGRPGGDIAVGEVASGDNAVGEVAVGEVASGDTAEPDPEEAEALPLLQALREGVRNGPLWRWLIAASLCTFLDEIVVAFAALHAEGDLGASAATAVACVSGVSAGAVLGAWVTDRLLGAVAPDRLLFGSTLVTLLTLGAVVLAPSPSWLALALVGLGASAAPQYALAKAKAYAASPGRPGVVNALAQVFVLVDIVGPLALGVLADRFGVGVAIACLVVQPLGVLGLLLGSRR